MACKPGSVPAQAGDDHSSRTPVSGRLARPTRAAVRKPTSRRNAGVPPLFGLAPGGVCRAIAVTGDAVRSYRTISPLPANGKSPAVCFLWRFPWGRPRRELPGTLVSVEPGLSSPSAGEPAVGAAIRPSGTGYVRSPRRAVNTAPANPRASERVSPSMRPSTFVGR